MEWKILGGVRFLTSWIAFCLHLKWFLPNDILVAFSELDSLSALLGYLVISGYSIANSLSTEPEHFLERRVLSIYPLYAIAVLISLLPFKLLDVHTLNINGLNSFFIEPTPAQIIGNLLLLQGFFVHAIGSNPPLWIMSIEVGFYLLGPLFLKTNRKVLISLILLSSLAYIAYPYLQLKGFFFLKHGLSFIFLLWAWLLGFLYYFNQKKFLARFGMISLGMVILALHQIHYKHVLSGFTHLFILIVLVFLPYIKLPESILNIFNYLGELSYPFYLVHVSCLIFSYFFLNIRNSVAMTVITLLFAALLHHLIDIPLRLQRSAVNQADI
ncbi:MAG: acyltransferase [Leptolyngbyaceae cyanobacterium RU_5_1]|nr:acyltransferase [Leptolyngbyaceae cyanobacterium RU_5_1]